MKKILFTLIVVLGAFCVQSCSLHEDTDLFGKPAAERLEEAVTADKELLESAPNGWILRYYTGQEYTGGGYTLLCKFKDGKAEVSADFMDDPTAKSHSSYDIVKDQGPVLTFDTFNEIMHQMAKPSQNDIDGEQGDYEFRIQKTTNDSIYLEGKKWHNKMVMVRMDENTAWADYLKDIQEMGDSLYYNNILSQNGDSIGFISVDNAVRRFSISWDNKGVRSSAEVPFYVTPEGIHLQEAVNLGGTMVSDFKFNKNTKELSCDNLSGYAIKGFLPEGYKPIKFWYGDWYVVCAIPDAKGQPTDKYTGYKLKLESYDDVAYVKGTLTISGKEYELYFDYDRQNGTLVWGQSYTLDPDNVYYYLMVAPLNFATGGYFNFKGSLKATWNEKQNRAYFKWDGVGTYEVDSFVFMAADSSGSPVYDENEQLIVVAQVPFIQGLQRIESTK